MGQTWHLQPFFLRTTHIHNKTSPNLMVLKAVTKKHHRTLTSLPWFVSESWGCQRLAVNLHHFLVFLLACLRHATSVNVWCFNYFVHVCACVCKSSCVFVCVWVCECEWMPRDLMWEVSPTPKKKWKPPFARKKKTTELQIQQNSTPLSLTDKQSSWIDWSNRAQLWQITVFWCSMP